MIEPEAMNGVREAKEEDEGTVEGEEDGNIRLFRLDPFVQPPILKALFEVLPLEDLAKCRLVSNLWKNESLSTWRSKATIRFRKDKLVSRRDDGSKRKTSLGEFLDLWDAGDWGSCPFKQFFFWRFRFKAGTVEQQRFLVLVGSHITSLTLVKCKFGGADNFRRMVFQALPSLQFLEMNHCNVGKDYGSPEEILVYKEPTYGVHGLKSLNIFPFPPSSMLMDMLSHFHKLESLRLEPDGRKDHRILLETIRLIRAQDRTKLPLKNFDVGFYLVLLEQDEDIALYIELLELQDKLNLPLQRLDIWFGLDDEPEYLVLKNINVLRDILQRHSSTLKWLKFNWDMPTLKTFPFGVRLEKLEELKLPPHSFDNLNYLRSTPNLRVLRMDVDTNVELARILEIETKNFADADSDNLFANSAQLEIGDWTLPSLTEIILLEFPLSVCNLGKLMKWMPNVERFEGVPLDDVKFAMICSNWKNMRILEDKGEELTDQGVIGHDEAGDNDVPNITKLEKLTSFATMSSRLTSTSVYEGFLKLANLKELSFGNFEDLDDEAKAALKRRKIKVCQEID